MMTKEQRKEYVRKHNRELRSAPPRGLCDCQRKATRWFATQQICDRCAAIDSYRIRKEIIAARQYKLKAEADKNHYISPFVKFAVRIADGINELIVSAHGNYHLKIS